MPDLPILRGLANRSRDFSNKPWFPTFGLVCAAVSILLWEFYPELHWLPLLVGLIPAGIRILAFRPPFERTPLDVPVWLFLITALISAWVSYDPQVAIVRLQLIVAAFILYYALVSQPANGLWRLAAFISLAGLLIATYFLLTHDWTAASEKIGYITRLGQMWMNIRPDLNAVPIYPNTAAGIVAPILPFMGALTWRAWKRKEILGSMIGIAALLITISCLILSATRGVWITYLVAAGILGLWGLSRGIAVLLRWKQEYMISLFLLVVFLIGLGWVLSSVGGLENLLNMIPGPRMAASRLGLQVSLFRLIEDFPLTGGGLGSFPGLYAHYILVNPNFIVPHGHNLFLDVGLDQGVLGLLSILWIFGASFWLLLRKRSKAKDALLWFASLLSLFCFVFQGQAADDFYYSPIVFSLFVLPGFAIALTRAPDSAPETTPISLSGPHFLRAFGTHFSKRGFGIVLGICGILLLFLVVFSKPILASVYSNLGALQMARTELPLWGKGEWVEPELEPLAHSESYFMYALRFNPENRTANHRLGLIAMYRGDFSMASKYLRVAHQMDPGHYGIWKNLGYSLAWSGNLKEAELILLNLPEAQRELQAYRWWWQKQNRSDLARYAARLEMQFSGGN